MVWVVIFRYMPLDTQGVFPRCTLHGKFGEPQVLCSVFGQEIVFFSLSGIESRFLKHPAYCVVNKHTMISRMNYAVQCFVCPVINICFKIKRVKWNIFPCLIPHKQVLLSWGGSSLLCLKYKLRFQLTVRTQSLYVFLIYLSEWLHVSALIRPSSGHKYVI